MEAPEKLYFFNNEPILKERSVKRQDANIEYTRTDAFIEKACAWIKYNNNNGGCLFDGWDDDFKNYMKGK